MDIDDITDGTLRNYVDGEWTPIDGDDGADVVNPATGETLGHVPFTPPGSVADVVSAGDAAFETWRNRAIEDRIQPLFRLKSLLEEHQEDIARVLVTEHGKNLNEARGELRRGIENVEVACGAPRLMQDGFLENAAPEIDEMAVRRPLGTFAAITPFNFPGMIPLWFLPYAVATGNSFVLKPSEQDPLTAQYLFHLIDEAGFPDGVVNLVHGGPDTVNALLENEDLAGASFVGSTPVARHVYETAARTGMRVQAQGGAKNYVVVSDSADLEYAAAKTVSSSFACGGERCLANDIAVVVGDAYEPFVEAVLDVVDDQVVGDGLDPDTDIGALISPGHAERVADLIDAGVEDGNELLRDGRGVTVDGYEEGTFIGPTVFGEVDTDSRIAQEEIFGPVLGIARADDFDEAVRKLNGTDFGNAASLFTARGGEAREFRNRADVGNIGVNVGTAAPMAFFHFGGRKDSFFGDLHAQAEDVVRFYTDETVYIERWPDV
ncbi:CoA-acylating methylmalonate-semialdehyde dehydrogenase [Halorubrum sp. JWXQ-INN 858]|uniref:CoA-acylating methylmalonate-semialdehyde dehydrogenase n=1 Tax=Halorubrum sp. JWXQ-INN 858 TaxID=2690782 RepID=UPI001359792B|nr:CoA-acylating methylmalonate-semialdehyde dehydrogenase [Halorubrum sp. JWXQ-INN 858]